VKYKTLRANPGAPHHRVAVNGMRLSRAGMEHAPTGATGTGLERTPWHATQRAAWDALKRTPSEVGRSRKTDGSGGQA
jgi:hypothetical protein